LKEEPKGGGLEKITEYLQLVAENAVGRSKAAKFSPELIIHLTWDLGQIFRLGPNYPPWR